MVHPVMSKSKCWCVNGENKFVLRVRPELYYRIELPNETPEDCRKVDELKAVLPKVLQYELTPCPFKRGFTVDLPDSPKTPTQKRPWTPKHRPVSLSVLPRLSLQNPNEPENSTTEADLIVMNDTNINSEDSEGFELRKDIEDEDNSKPFASINAALQEVEDVEDTFDDMKTPTRLKAFGTTRSVTAPPELILRTISSSIISKERSRPSERESDTASIASSVDSFHSVLSFHSPISPLPPSPPYSNPPSPPRVVDHDQQDLAMDMSHSHQHKRDISEITVTTDSYNLDLGPLTETHTPTWPAISGHSSPIDPETPALTTDGTSPSDDEDWLEPPTHSPSITLDSHSQSIPLRSLTSHATTLRHHRRRALSPLPPPANIYSPRTRATGHHLTTEILEKTCSLVLGSGIHLVALMLNLARRMASGGAHGEGEGYRHQEGKGASGTAIPWTWDFGAEEDDYGILLERVGSRGERNEERRRGGQNGGSNERDFGGSWEID